MKKILFLVTIINLLAFANTPGKCYFMNRVYSNNEIPKLFNINCNVLENSLNDMEYFRRAIGREGILIYSKEFFDNNYKEHTSVVMSEFSNGIYTGNDDKFFLFSVSIFNDYQIIGCKTAATNPECDYAVITFLKKYIDYFYRLR